jgi:DNA-directed RNA polymerase subunit beta'
MALGKVSDFEAVRLKLASSDKILEWSCGEVLKPETINYRTQKPEKDGLFCERIFGPVKDWECYCGKYRRIRYKGIVCDKCGVEVTRSIVRRERMGHIKLAVPVSHIWFLRGIPSRIGMILGISAQDVEKVIYFASYVIVKVDEEARRMALEGIKKELEQKSKSIKAKHAELKKEVNSRKSQKFSKLKKEKEKNEAEKVFNKEIEKVKEDERRELENLREAHTKAKEELSELEPLKVISEVEYHSYSMKYGGVFEAGIGAEAIRNILEKIDLEAMAKGLEEEISQDKAASAKAKKTAKRLRLVKGMLKARVRPEWMIPTVVPVIPPDLRPMVQLDGGRFATSDLNDLYRRVINRNNRLKKLIEIGAPEVIQRNEKRMLQEAVDALFDNGARKGQAVQASTGQRRLLRSLADNLKGKQGRFRQNLLGKRVDYSGRSVIVVGPDLDIDQCGLPKKMALELFKPFVINKIIEREFAHNVRSASRLIEQESDIVYDILEEVIQDKHVLLNRAPTLHRLGIQAFRPILVEGKAIQIHPLVCSAFNADFDGDQMAVHLPLTEIAQSEARELMSSKKNLLKPSTGDPIAVPSQDMVLGCYYMTKIKPKGRGEGKIFTSADEAVLAYQMRAIGLQSKIKLRMARGKYIDTSVGRIIFNRVLPKQLRYVNEEMNKKFLKKLIADALNQVGLKESAVLIDKLKNLSFKYATRSGLSWGMGDLVTPEGKKELLKESESSVEKIREQYEMGLLTDEERYVRVVQVWTEFKEKLTELVKKSVDKSGPVFAMIDSGARGSWEQTTQMVGAKGTVVNPAGKIIELPIKSSFEEGFNVLEYFISTHGTRKGMADTALRTATAGYLTRRLVDVSQDVVVLEEDCGTKEGIFLNRADSDEIGEDFASRIRGRVVCEAVVDPDSGEVIVEKGKVITKRKSLEINAKDAIKKVNVRSVVKCETGKGVCQHCYGYDLGSNEMVKIGSAVGIVAAQAIGEPGTQLTMRTFHTGGVTAKDITQGLPRVEEIFEARNPKGEALISEVNGRVVEIVNDGKNKIIRVESEPARKGAKKKEVEYKVQAEFQLEIEEGDLVTKGQKLTEGNTDLKKLHKLAGPNDVYRSVLKDVKEIYATQGESINDKHIEVIIKQMFSRIRITDSGETGLLVGSVVKDSEFFEVNRQAKLEGKKESKGERLLMGITKASLSTDSFLAAASFQETSRVLIEAAVMGKTDRLLGLKENVIIGRLIPVGTGLNRKSFLKK